MEKSSLSNFFLITLVIGVIFVCYLIFKPFLIEIIAAMILVSIFYSPYKWLVKKFHGRKNLSALLMCFLIAFLVIVPIINFLVYSAQKSVEAYSAISKNTETINLSANFFNNKYDLDKFNFLGLDSDSFKNIIIDLSKGLSDWLVSGGTNFVKMTTNFMISFVIILFTMFFFFVDGRRMVEKLMYWTPLPNKYDKMIFQKFQNVSRSIMLSTFITAIAQGFIGAIGFLIVGFPAFFAGIAMAFLSLIPYVGTALVWFPVGIYLLIIGQTWQGVFIIIWGAIVVGSIDNLLRAYIIKNKAQVHPIFIIFSILGGIILFGFWGIIFGPLIISLSVTILNIYEIEYGSLLEK